LNEADDFPGKIPEPYQTNGKDQLNKESSCFPDCLVVLWHRRVQMNNQKTMKEQTSTMPILIRMTPRVLNN
jgi:hypothetical protein